MGADNFENLGFSVKIDGADSAVTHLNNIIERLVKIKNLEKNSVGSKSGLSADEKYAKRVANATQVLNSKKYEELRRTELLNQQRKKEIDQRLKQELGIENSTKSLSKFITKTTSLLVISRKLAKLFASSVKESAAYIENLNLFSVAFGESYEQQLDWALGIANAYGLANNEVLRFAGTFRELASSLGLVGDTADLVSQTVTNLGYDLAALFNTTVEQAMEKLQSGVFSGNVRPLRSFGIDISQQQIDALIDSNEALAQFGINAKSLTQAEKTIARLIITLQSGKDSFGTMAREINNLQSQFRIFEGSIANFKLAIGDLVEKPLSRVMVYINAFIIALTDMIRTIVPLTTKDETPKTITNIASGADEASEEIENLEKKLASFDKFNVLQDNNSNSGSLTEVLNELLQEQADLYNNELSAAMEQMQNEAVELAKKMKDVVQWSVIFFSVWSITKLTSTITNIKLMKEAILKLAGSTQTLTKTASLLNTLLLSSVVYVIYKAIKAFKEGDTATGVLATTIGIGLVGAWALLNAEIIKTKLDSVISLFKSFAKSLKTTVNPSLRETASAATATQMAFSLFSATFALGAMANLWQQEISLVEKLTHTFIGLAAAIGAAVIAKNAFNANWAQALSTAGVIAAGYYSIASMSAHADGGYSNANLIMTHENGKREWVGKAAGSSAIVNDTQMSDIMEVAVAKGVYNALSARSSMGSNVPTNETIVVKIGEEAVFNAVRKTARRQGRDFVNV